MKFLVIKFYLSRSLADFKNVFKVPSGNAANSFVKELAHFIRAYAEASAPELVALKAAMIKPPPLLQNLIIPPRQETMSLHFDAVIQLDPVIPSVDLTSKQLSLTSFTYTYPMPERSSIDINQMFISSSMEKPSDHKRANKIQGDFLAMDMYTIGTIPLILQLSNESTKQTCFVYDTSVSGDLSAL